MLNNINLYLCNSPKSYNNKKLKNLKPVITFRGIPPEGTDVLRIAVGADHGGVSLKTKIVEFLRSLGHNVEDVGTHSTESCDYPVFAKKVADRVGNGKANRGVLICTTGVGMSIQANRTPGVRAVLASSKQVAQMSREHNDTNVLCLGASVPGDSPFEILKIWLATKFSEGERHIRRIKMLDEKLPKN